MLQKRDIVLAVILSIVTCGIYGLYWFVVITDDTKRVCNDPYGTSGGTALLLTIITCGIYGIYWAYKQGQKVDYANNMRGVYTGSTSILYMILWIVGLGIVVYALNQDSINKIIDIDSANYYNQQNGGYHY